MFAQSIPVLSDGHGGHFQSFSKSMSMSNVNGVGRAHVSESIDGQKPVSKDFVLKNHHAYSAQPQMRSIFAEPSFHMPAFHMPAFHMPSFHMPNMESEFQMSPMFASFHGQPHVSSAFEESEVQCVNGHCKAVEVHSPSMRRSLFHLF